MATEIAEVAAYEEKIVVQRGQQCLRLPQGFIPPAKVEIGNMDNAQTRQGRRPAGNGD